MAIVPITVIPASSSCAPPTAGANVREPTIFMFTLADPAHWEWQGTSPVVVQNGAQEFYDSFIHPNGRNVVLFDKNTDGTGSPTPATKYKYTVTIVNITTGVPMSIDPFIQNQ